MLGIIIAVAVILGMIALIGARDRKTAHEKAVAQFQSEFGITPTGTVDERTWNELTEAYYRLKEATE